ncbi:MAG: hypothetical protein JOZ69_17955, partial [Myxococcales bacterium]|nr:hypothetical protein [Myxococcales bacterium]
MAPTCRTPPPCESIGFPETSFQNTSFRIVAAVVPPPPAGEEDASAEGGGDAPAGPPLLELASFRLRPASATPPDPPFELPGEPLPGALALLVDEGKPPPEAVPGVAEPHAAT